METEDLGAIKWPLCDIVQASPCLTVLFWMAAPVVPNTASPALAPEADPTVEADAPTTGSGIRPVLTPSAARPSYQFSPSLLLALLAALVLKFY